MASSADPAMAPVLRTKHSRCPDELTTAIEQGISSAGGGDELSSVGVRQQHRCNRGGHGKLRFGDLPPTLAVGRSRISGTARKCVTETATSRLRLWCSYAWNRPARSRPGERMNGRAMDRCTHVPSEPVAQHCITANMRVRQGTASWRHASRQNSHTAKLLNRYR